jgi:tetratricopeptide (TPR) repeat protein
MIGGVFVSLSFSDVFGDLFSDNGSDSENYADPNRDVIAAQETIVAQNPDDLEAILLLANLLGNSSRLGDAIPLYERALELAPEDVGARVSFARALADGNMHADAELQFQKALELDPESQQAHYYLAELYLASDPVRTEEALDHYREAARLDSSTLIGERAQTQLDTLGAGTPEATPVNSGPTPAEATP